MSFRSHLLAYALPITVALCSLLLFLGAVDVFEHNVALYHDAVWDFIPAVAMIRAESLRSDFEVKVFHRPVPILSSPYSGALKIWLLAPMVKLLPLSPHLILVLNVLFGLLYLLALYWALLPLAGKIWASAVLAIPFVDTNFLITVPVDTGITLTQYIFIALALGAFFRFASDPKLKYHRVAYFLCGCILAQKLTALPVVISIVFVLTVVAFNRFLEAVRVGTIRRAITSYFLIPAALFTAPLFLQIYYFSRHGFAGLNESTAGGKWMPYFAAIRSNFAFFFTSFDGWDWYRRLTLDDRPEMIKTPFLAIFGLSIIAFSLAVYSLSHRGRRSGRDSALCFAIGSIGFLLYPAFRGLYRPWHFYILEPLFLCCSVLASRHLVDWSGERFKYVSRAVVCAVLIFLISASTWHSIDVLKQFSSRKGVCLASPAFYNLYDSILRSKVKLVYAINYSMAYPIYVLSKGTVRVDEVAWTQLTPDKMEGLIRNVRTDPEAVIVYRYCGCKNSEPAWVEWLNRETELPAFIKRLGSEAGGLSTVRFRDDRQTEFVLISQKRD
jgi:hypothetical protein